MPNQYTVKDATRLRARLDKQGPIPPHRPELGACWPADGYRTKDGYARFRLAGRQMNAHIAAFLLSGGVLSPDKPCVLHHCDNPPCCRPSHLFAGSKADNNKDRDEKGRRVNATGARNGQTTAPHRMARGERINTAKLTAEQVLRIRSQYAAGGVLQTELAVQYGVTQGLIGQIVNRRIWKHLIAPLPSSDAP